MNNISRNVEEKIENKVTDKILLEKLAILSYKNKMKSFNSEISITKQKNSKIKEENKENIILNRNKRYSFISELEGENNNNIKYNKNKKRNKIKNDKPEEDIYKNKNEENFIKNKINYNKKKVIIIQYFFIYILFSPFNIIESKIIINENKVYNIKYNLYEIKLKLKGTGIINILSSSSSYNYTCPSNIDLIKGPYLNVTLPSNSHKWFRNRN